MKIFLVAGINDSGKSTLIKQIVENTRAGNGHMIGGIECFFIKSSEVKREIMRENDDLKDFYLKPWSCLDQDSTNILNHKFYSNLLLEYSNRNCILIIETHLTFMNLKRSERGFDYELVNVVSDYWMSHVCGIILMDTPLEEVLSRRNHGREAPLTDLDRVRTESTAERVKAVISNSQIGVQLIKLDGSYPAQESSKLSLEFISVASARPTGNAGL